MARPPGRISIRQMELIWAILTHGTMAKAAQELNISQPAISRMVKHAEERTGLQLFERRGSKLIPTPDLNILATEFERVFTNVDRVQNLTRALGAGWGRPIRLSTMSGIGEALLAPAVAGYRADNPNTPLAIKLNNRQGVERDILREDADLGIAHGVFDHESLDTVQFCRGRLVCLVPRDHRLAPKAALSPRDLVNENLISMGRRSPLSQKVIAAFEDEGAERHIAIQVADSRLAAIFCIQEGGIALLDPFFLGTVAMDDFVVRRFEPHVATECFVVHSNRRTLSPAELELIGRLKEAGEVWESNFVRLISSGSET